MGRSKVTVGDIYGTPNMIYILERCWANVTLTLVTIFGGHYSRLRTLVEAIDEVSLFGVFERLLQGVKHDST